MPAERAFDIPRDPGILNKDTTHVPSSRWVTPVGLRNGKLLPLEIVKPHQGVRR